MKAAFEKLSTLSQNNGFDVLLVMTTDIHNLKRGLAILNKIFKRFHLSINVSKTKTMIFSHNETISEYLTFATLLTANTMGIVA